MKRLFTLTDCFDHMATWPNSWFNPDAPDVRFWLWHREWRQAWWLNR